MKTRQVLPENGIIILYSYNTVHPMPCIYSYSLISSPLCKKREEVQQHACGQNMSRETIPYSGKLSREKTFMNFVVLCLFTKVFSAKIDSHTHTNWWRQAIHESFLREFLVLQQFVKVFSLKSFSLYGIAHNIL